MFLKVSPDLDGTVTGRFFAYQEGWLVSHVGTAHATPLDRPALTSGRMVKWLPFFFAQSRPGLISVMTPRASHLKPGFATSFLPALLFSRGAGVILPGE